jgi:glutathione S-transferase
MAETIKLYHLGASPNCMKARIALAYKGLAYESIVVDPKDRSEVVKVSGQPFTPVLVHDEYVLFDSSAILRYLDANFRATKPLFSSDYETMRAIERWERLGRNELSEPIGIAFRQLMSGTPVPAELARASALLNEHTGQLEARLREGDWLVGNAMTAADVVVAPAVHYGVEPQHDVSGSPMLKFFADNLKLGAGRDKTRAWVRRVMAWDK